MSLASLSRSLNFLPLPLSNEQYSHETVVKKIMARKDLKSMNPQPKVYKLPPYTVEAPGATKVDGETIPRRNIRTKDQLPVTPEEGINTVYDVVRRASRCFGNAKALGKRKLIRTHDEIKKVTKMVDGKEQEVDKKWTYFELGPYNYMSFVEYEQMVLQVGSGLRALGLHKDDRVHIFASTHPHWLATAHGAASQSMPIVTAYDTLGESGLKHSLLQARSKLIFLDPHLLTALIGPAKEAKDIQHVIYNDDDTQTTKAEPAKLKADIQKLKEAHPHLSVHAFSELLKLGRDNMVEPVPPQADDLCCIMYTSGSTGSPKGVLLTHKNILASVTGVNTVVGMYLGPGDGLMTYLPLAHILEFVFETTCLFWGGTMGYGGVRTLSDTEMRNCKGDLQEFKPTVLVGVPALFEKVKKGIMAKVAKMGPLKGNMFWGAVAAKSFMMANSGYLPFSGVGTSIVDTVVFKKVQEATGGRLRICMNGGGPIAKETQRFISMALAPMISGYGLTETAAMGALMDPLAWTDSALGEIPGSVEVKLVDFVDAGYRSTNSPPQGEIWIRGAAVSSGYLDLEKETQESFTADGWFKTGDIGEFDAAGQLRIIDRKKNLVKTLNGEYIALEKLESVYRSCAVVNNICVYAAQDKNKPIALVVPVEPALQKLAKDIGVTGEFDDLCANAQVRAAVLKELQTMGRRGGLAGFEIIEGVVLSDEEWTPQNVSRCHLCRADEQPAD